MASYDLNTTQVAQSITSSDLPTNIKDAIQTTLASTGTTPPAGPGGGNTGQTNLKVESFTPPASGGPVEIPTGTNVALAGSGGQYNANVTTNSVILVQGNRPTTVNVTANETSKVVIVGGRGNDVLGVSTGGFSRAAAAGDTVVGATGGATIDGGDGNDSVSGAAGNDSLSGGEGNDTISAGAGNDSLSGGVGDDSLSGGAGDDYILAIGGSDSIDGGTGYDQVVVDGARAQYSVTFQGSTVVLRNGNTVKTVSGAEFIGFQTGGPLVTAADQTQAGVARLYEVMLGRGADGAGLGFWLDKLASGLTLTQLAQGFTQSAEFRALSVGQSNETFIDGLYQQALHRNADTAGRAYYLEKLNNGSIARVNMAVSFSMSDEAQGTFDYIHILGTNR